MKIKEIWFDAEHIYGRDEEGNEYSQSLLWYPKLRMATDEERAAYTFGFDGIHWRELDEDISFESFAYDDAEPTSLQRFFLTHKEINVAEFARSLGMNATLLRNYINGFKKPSAEREKAIIDHIHKLGREMIAACFLHQWFQETVSRAREGHHRPYPQVGQGNDSCMFLKLRSTKIGQNSLTSLRPAPPTTAFRSCRGLFRGTFCRSALPLAIARITSLSL